jgi:hypothetical protein
MDYMIKIQREVCVDNSTTLRDVIDTDPEEGVYFVGNYKTHENDKFTSLTEAKAHEANLKQSWQDEEDARIAAIPKPSTERPVDFIIESSHL